jgi:hypothetical protein
MVMQMRKGESMGARDANNMLDQPRGCMYVRATSQ